MTHENCTYPTESTYNISTDESDTVPEMKLLTADAADPLSFLALSTVLSTASCFASPGTETDDWAISVISPI
jgi:hypothetical protein